MSDTTTPLDVAIMMGSKSDLETIFQGFAKR